ncbi:MAG: hypothetical protein ACLFUU_12930 [Desulfobacteraceae bacterium]
MRKHEAAQVANLAESLGYELVRYEIRERRLWGYDYSILVRNPQTQQVTKIRKAKDLKSFWAYGRADNVEMPNLL